MYIATFLVLLVMASNSSLWILNQGYFNVLFLKKNETADGEGPRSNFCKPKNSPQAEKQQMSH